MNFIWAQDEVKVGDKLPSVVLKEGQADYGSPVDVNLSELIAGKKGEMHTLSFLLITMIPL